MHRGWQMVLCGAAARFTLASMSESDTFVRPMATSEKDDQATEKDSADETDDAGEEQASESQESSSSESSSEGAAKKDLKAGAGKKSQAQAQKSGAKRSSRHARGRPAPASPAGAASGSVGKSAVLFVVVVGGLAAGMAILGRDPGGGNRVAPGWQIGQTVDVELTLKNDDKTELVCASVVDVKGLHCAQETSTKPWAKPDLPDEKDKKLLKPYTTTNGAELLGAGLWSDPALSGQLPPSRFSVKCKFKVEGKVSHPGIRWGSDKPFYDSPNDWFAGTLSGCTVTP